MKLGYLLKQWLWCSWIHRDHICYAVWDGKGKPRMNSWHCEKCHPCDEGMQEYLDSLSGK